MTASLPTPGQRGERLRAARLDAVRTVEDLEAELAGIVDQQVAVAPDDEHDAEGSTIGFERARVTALLGHASRVLADLDLAQERMTTGAYGRCTVCGQAIPGERLDAMPTATTCVGCASDPAGSVGGPGPARRPP